ncbi:MAG: LPXTG cell wall anchor domain-containing protein [Actinomycetota bacterium]|nr:LPXTG cell wall anchor domain-containing protein [Actinomycetota bacterium]
MPRLVLSLKIGLLAAVLLVTPAAAQEYPPQGEEIFLSDVSLVPGESFTVSGAGWTPGSTVDLRVNPPLGTATVAADGTFAVGVTLPADTPCGAGAVTGSNGPDEWDSVAIDVVCGAAALAATGGDLTVGATLAAVLLALGAFLVYRSRRRPTLAAPTAQPPSDTPSSAPTP